MASGVSVLLEAATSICVAHLVSESCAEGLQHGLRRSWRTRLSCVWLIAHAGSAIWSQAFTTAASSGLATRFSALLFAHYLALVLEYSLKTYDTSRLAQLHRSLLRSIIYVAPAYPLLVILSSTLLMLGASTLRLGESLHWLIDIGSLHAPFWFVHAHTRRAVQHEPSTLPVFAPSSKKADENDEHVRRQRLMRFGIRSG